jgi:hypothetical protein
MKSATNTTTPQDELFAERGMLTDVLGDITEWTSSATFAAGAADRAFLVLTPGLLLI